MMKKLKARSINDNIEIELKDYDGVPNPHNPYDRLSPDERHAKIVKLYAHLYHKMSKKEETAQTDTTLKSFPC